MAQRDLDELSVDECFGLLGAAHVGRLVYLDDGWPVAIPVNFAVADREIVVRVGGGTKQAAMAQPRLAFEVDHIDDDHRSGWSVLLRGTGRELPPDTLPVVIRQRHGDFPKPWASGVHNTWLKITPTAVTGRRLGPERAAPAF